MITEFPEVLQDVQRYVEALFNKLQRAELLYHNLEHTQKVVQRCKEISSAYVMAETDIFILIAAAWFHDTGHLSGTLLNHEEKSVEIMKDYFKEKKPSDAIVEAIASCIMATKIPHRPKTLPEKMICDADTYHLGTADFIHTDERLKKELQLRDYNATEAWDSNTLNMLVKHKYFTVYCRELLDKGKQENIDIILKRMKMNRNML